MDMFDHLANAESLSPTTLRRIKDWMGREDIRYVTKSVLVLIAVGGLTLAATVVAPGAISGLAPILKEFGQKPYRHQRLRRRLRRLGLVRVVTRPDGNGDIVLTKRGRAVALRAHLEVLAIEQPKKWDKWWRLVIFDVPEKHRVARDFLREKLRQLNFLPIQRSAWILPWPCENEMRLIRERYGFDDTIAILTIPDSFEFDPWRDHFFKKQPVGLS